MADNKDNISIEEIKEESADTKDTTAADTNEDNDALKSFLESDTSDVLNAEKSKTKKQLKIAKGTLWIIIGVICVAIIIGAIFIIKSIPAKTDDEPFSTKTTQMTLTVDEDGEHQADVVLNEKGKLEENGTGTLIEYTPSDIKQIDIENESGSFTVLAETKITTDEETGEENREATVYTLVGFEDTTLQSGTPDTIANDVAKVTFNSVADYSGKKSDDFGFENPRATVKTHFTDGTTSTIYVGDDAPSQAGTYVMFGNSKTVYLASADAVDGLLFSVLDLVTLEINAAATDTSNTSFETLTISGSAVDSDIELRQNDDKAINSTYKMIKPNNMFVSEVEAANISGAIRGLFADEAMCVNPSSSQLSEFGLSKPYMELNAIYPDTTVNIKASAVSNGYAYIIADSNIIYKMAESKIPWIHTNLSKLTPDVVINPSFTALKNITVTDKSGTYSFDVVTTTDTVDTTEGTQQEVTVTTATYKDEQLDSDNFQVFYQNICNMTNAGATDSGAGSDSVLTIELSYSTGRANDVIEIYPTGNSKYIAALNGNVTCLVYKSYCTKFSQCVQDLIKGNTVSSF